MEFTNGISRLAAIAQPGNSYTVQDRIELGELVGNGEAQQLIFDVGDVIVVQSNDSRLGLQISSTKYPRAEIVLSPEQAASINVESL